jgi:tripartite-type tricarboxylate transporter receptor subunit TctC
MTFPAILRAVRSRRRSPSPFTAKEFPMSVRRIQCFLAAALLLACAAASAQEFPQKDLPVRIIVPATAGGTTDIIARAVQRHLQAALNVPVIVENRAGAGGVIGASALLASKPDGHTILFAPSALGVRSALDRKLPYEAERDMAGIALLAKAPSFLVVAPTLQVTTAAQLVALGRTQSSGLNYGSAGVGSTAHLHGAMFAKMAGFGAQHIPQRGTPEALNEVIAGRLEYAFAPAPNVLALAKGGRLLVLASSSTAGRKFMPNVPTLSQAGVPGYEGEDWFAALAPAKTPKAVRERLSKELAQILALPDVRETLLAAGAEPVSNTPDEMDTMLRTYITNTRKLADDMKISID